MVSDANNYSTQWCIAKIMSIAINLWGEWGKFIMDAAVLRLIAGIQSEASWLPMDTAT